MNESEKRDKYLDLEGEVRKNPKLWNMKVTVIPIVVGALDIVTKGFLERLEDLEIWG